MVLSTINLPTPIAAFLGRMFPAQAAVQQLRGLMPRLERFKQDLTEIADQDASDEERMELLVCFYQTTFPWCHRIEEIEEIRSALGEKAKYAPLVQVLKEIVEALHETGSNPYGLNRAKVDQKPNEYNVFIGNVGGRHTHSVVDWLRMGTPEDKRILGKRAHQYYTIWCRKISEYIERLGKNLSAL